MKVFRRLLVAFKPQVEVADKYQAQGAIELKTPNVGSAKPRKVKWPKTKSPFEEIRNLPNEPHARLAEVNRLLAPYSAGRSSDNRAAVNATGNWGFGGAENMSSRLNMYIYQLQKEKQNLVQHFASEQAFII